MALTDEEWEILLITLLVFAQALLQQLQFISIVLRSGLRQRHRRRCRRPRALDQRLLVTMLLFYEAMCLIAFQREYHILSPNYIEPRSREWSGWYLSDVLAMDPVRFKYLFRVSPATFRYICDLVRHDLTTNPPPGLRKLTNRTLSVERQVALALRRFASGCLLLTLSETFGVSVPCCSDVIWRFVTSLIYRARSAHLSWPQGRDMERVKEDFFHLQGFPNCCGAIDATHFQIELPLGTNSTDYRDYKNGQSISMQVVCDSRLRFLDVFAGWPGSIQDSRLLKNSAFFDDVLHQRTKLSGPTFRSRWPQFTTGEYVIGDSGYPCYPWLLNPFPGVTERSRKRQFNYMLSSTRMVVERAIGQVKNTFCFVSRKMFRPSPKRLPYYVLCCCLLHNIRIDCGDAYDPAWGVDEDPPYDPGLPPASHIAYRGGRNASIRMMNYMLPRERWEQEQRQRDAQQRVDGDGV